MKVFFNKLKNCRKSYSITYIILSIFYLITLGFFLYSLSRLHNIENVLRLIVTIIMAAWLFIYLIVSPIKLFTKKNKSFIAISIITGILIPILIIASLLVNYFFKNFDFTKDYLTYTTNLVTLTDTEFNSSSKIGMISNENDLEGYKLAKKLYERDKMSNEIVSYEDYYEMLADLYSKKIDAIFITSNYTIIFSSEETYQDIANQTKVIAEYSEKLENQDLTLKSNKKLSEPFTVLLMGVDSEIDGLDVNQAFNGDTLMMITFNPKTLTATMFSMPRDMYVPIACRNNNLAKVNSSAAYGSGCVINTLQNITGIDIDYYVKMNFKGVVDLVNAVGGITINVETPNYAYNHGHNCNGKFCEQNSNRKWGKDTIYLDPGIQTLNGEQALAYARCRALYTESDIARNRHQQEIIEAVAQKFSTIKSLDGFQQILNAISKNMDTNITTDQMLSFYEVAKDMLFKNDSDELISIQKTYLEYYDLPVYLPGSDTVTSALGYYDASLEAIKKAMRVNLELESAEMPKTISISVNENYESKIIGKGLTDDSRVETMPSFTNKTVTEATSWGASHNIPVYIEYVDYTSEYYNPDVSPGLIANQSVHRGTFLTNISSLTIYINSGTAPENPVIPEEPDSNENEIPDIDIPGSPTPE